MNFSSVNYLFLPRDPMLEQYIYYRRVSVLMSILSSQVGDKISTDIEHYAVARR